MNYFADVLRDKYADFSGRARRQEYWMFYLIVCAISLVLGIFVGIFSDSALAFVFYALSFLFSLAILVPSLALCVRRLHDIGKDWPWIFITFVPFIGGIWFFILMVTDSQPGDNQWGPYPK